MFGLEFKYRIKVFLLEFRYGLRILKEVFRAEYRRHYPYDCGNKGGRGMVLGERDALGDSKKSDDCGGETLRNVDASFVTV